MQDKCIAQLVVMVEGDGAKCPLQMVVPGVMPGGKRSWLVKGEIQHEGDEWEVGEITWAQASMWCWIIGTPATGNRGLGTSKDKGLKRVPARGERSIFLFSASLYPHSTNHSSPTASPHSPGSSPF